MFLSALQRQNPRLIQTALALWQQGAILPDSYVIDLPQVLQNGRQLVNCARRQGLKLYLMGKQFGRNPLLCRELLKCGFDGIVAVDFKEARHYFRHHLPVAHIGHLVQPPTALLTQILAQKPQVITLYSLEKAQQINQVAARLGICQAVLIKICQDGDIVYPGQESGIGLAQLPAFVAALQQMTNLTLVGVTHFPCCLFDQEQKRISATPNLSSLIQAAQQLRQSGIDVRQINAPSLTCSESIPLLAQAGATHGEPGHALTGTIPSNQHGDQAEKIAMLYLSEISHTVGNYSYCFGGGYYRRGHLTHALVGRQLIKTEVLATDSDSIDYTLRLQGRFAVGEAVIMCFRTQIFTTRSDVALVEPLQNRLTALYDSLGNPLGEQYA
ncbi:YhfX family PLP-dependent enzyme [Pasteurella testudinis]|uniref:YhfX family PLP-dependent enzyme n=1 Tax=Pasteurella testudinis TaxID=761 RepID=UPI004057E596